MFRTEAMWVLLCSASDSQITATSFDLESYRLGRLTPESHINIPERHIHIGEVICTLTPYERVPGLSPSSTDCCCLWKGPKIEGGGSKNRICDQGFVV